MKSLSIIIPCFNEYTRLYKNLPIIMGYCEDYLKDYEIIFVNDGSTDNTLRLIRSIENNHIKIITYTQNRGKGYAVRQGLKSATKDLVLFMDADLATSIYCITDALRYANKLEIVSKEFIIIGDREAPKSSVTAPILRKFIGRIFNKLQYMILHINVSDTQCGFKLFSRTAITKIIEDLQIDGWAFDVEVLYLCNQNKIKIECMPVIWHDVTGSKVHPLKDSFKMFKELLRIKRIHG